MKRLPFQRLVREITQDFRSGLRLVLKLLIYDLAIHRFRTGFNIIGLGSRQNVDYTITHQNWD